jgi:tRNA pseudouridine13 synthase
MLTDSLAYLTPDLTGVGGVLKERPEDFLVEEQPLYQPCGEGEHLYLFIEKRGMTTPEAAQRIAAAFRTHRRNIGHAGLKDKHAVTRQHLSVWLPGATDAVVAESLDRLRENTKLTVLWAERHTNKLRRGHHGGNRFVLRLRQVEPTHVVRAKRILDVLEQRGIPNYVGEQRFGYRQNSHVLGRLLLQDQPAAFLDEMLGSDYDTESPYIVEGRAHYRAGDYTAALDVWPKTLRFDRQALDALRQGKPPAEAVRCIDRGQRDFLVSAWQSAVFNEVLGERVRSGSFDKLLPGDLAWKHDNRSVFAVDEATAEKENAPEGRVPRGEVSPSGPNWGAGMTRATGEPGAMERAALERSGITEDHFRGRCVEGGRRPMRVPLKHAEVSAGADEHGPYIRAGFELPRGSYATMVMREVMKPEPRRV